MGIALDAVDSEHATATPEKVKVRVSAVRQKSDPSKQLITPNVVSDGFVQYVAGIAILRHAEDERNLGSHE